MSNKEPNKTINWPSFLSQHDMIWEQVAYKDGYYGLEERKHGLKRRYRKEWEEGAFIGNGMMGAMIYKESPQVWRWELGRNDVIAHNFLEGIDWAVPRVPIGDIIMKPSQPIIKETMRLHLWDAAVTGTIETHMGHIHWKSFNHATEDVIVIEVKTSHQQNSVSFGLRPEHGISPRIQYVEKNPPLVSLPPKPVQYVKDDIQVSVQTFIKDEGHDTYTEEGACAIAWKEVEQSETHKILYVSVTNSRYDQSAVQEALDNLKKAMLSDMHDYTTSHCDWWHDYYASSYVSFSDKKWERFYWIQMYKLACAMKEEGVVLDSQGPWLTITPWPTTVWNLNVQLCYAPLYTSNRLKLGYSLIHTLKANKEVLINNAKPMGIDDGMYVSRATNPIDLYALWPDTSELGNLTWVLHNIWRHYQVTMDKALLKDFLFPYLKANMNAYLHLMIKGEDGTYHIPDTSSPEYPSIPQVNCYPIMDCNYTLALCKWGCQTLLEINKELDLQDTLAEKWQDVLDHLTDYPINENGYMVGADVPFDVSHRHYSHLFMIYPLHLVNGNEPAEKALMEKSISHWLGFKGALQGYTYTGAANMAAYMQDGNKALEYLNGLDAYLCPNTMYAEKGPVIETPLSATESIHYMLLQSHSGRVDVFPAVPDAWEDVEFHDFRAAGAFEVSAKREKGHVDYIHIKSLAGSPLRIKPHLGRTLNYQEGKYPCSVTEIEEGVFDIQLQKGDCITLY